MEARRVPQTLPGRLGAALGAALGTARAGPDPQVGSTVSSLRSDHATRSYGPGRRRALSADIRERPRRLESQPDCHWADRSPEDSRDSKSGPSSSSTGSSSPNCRLGERTFFPESESKTGSARVIGGQALSPPTFLRSPVAPRNVTDTVMQRIFISKHNFNYS